MVKTNNKMVIKLDIWTLRMNFTYELYVWTWRMNLTGELDIWTWHLNFILFFAEPGESGKSKPTIVKLLGNVKKSWGES